MSIISGLAMVARARAMVGVSVVPQGMCLNFVWLRAGGLSSIGTSVGRMDTAYNSWLATPESHKHHDDWNAPIGSVVYYGPSPTRTDKNKNAGDIGISIGGGYGIFTDAAGQGSRVGIMTLRGRAAQIGRPYLGWAASLGGHGISLASTASADDVREEINNPTPPRKAHDMDGTTVILDRGPSTEPLFASTGMLLGTEFHVTSRGGENRGVLEALKSVASSSGGLVNEVHVDRVGWNQFALLERHEAAKIDVAALAAAVVDGMPPLLVAEVDRQKLADSVVDTLVDRLGKK